MLEVFLFFSGWLLCEGLGAAVVFLLFDGWLFSEKSCFDGWTVLDI